MTHGSETMYLTSRSPCATVSRRRIAQGIVSMTNNYTYNFKPRNRDVYSFDQHFKDVKREIRMGKFRHTLKEFPSAHTLQGSQPSHFWYIKKPGVTEDQLYRQAVARTQNARYRRKVYYENNKRRRKHNLRDAMKYASFYHIKLAGGVLIMRGPERGVDIVLPHVRKRQEDRAHAT